MKIEVKLNRIVEEICTFEVASMQEAKKEIEALTNDDFSEIDKYHEVSVYWIVDENSDVRDITGDIQPNMLKIGD